MGMIVKIENKDGLFRDLTEHGLLNELEYIQAYLIDYGFNRMIGETVAIRMNGHDYYCFHFLTEHYVDEDGERANEDDAKRFQYLRMDVIDR
ncbi:hypothetical protein HNR44_001739 [Geomicrobium halophilum]|uniref:Uncharacterized protein n=1 Tax=Geomicrobium halophilum TaxID=549000 RepID=A0A841PTY3_9BACL|nr:hypothetical protein [Geomicrobium halophilum]MBB6449761.1 hypothetical protein [Geomicrobium halophilum]